MKVLQVEFNELSPVLIDKMVEAGELENFRRFRDRSVVATTDADAEGDLLQPWVQWTTVHYKGNAPATNDLLGGQVQFNLDQVSVAQPFIKDGRTRALAVIAPKRVPWLPDVPTLDEQGIKGVEGQTFTGLLAPAGALGEDGGAGGVAAQAASCSPASAPFGTSATAARAVSTSAVNVAGSETAISARTLRSASTPASFRPCMNRL